MKLGYKYYKIFRKDALDAVEAYLSEKTEIFKRQAKLARKIGASTTRSFVSEIGASFKITGLSFDKPPKDRDMYLKDTSQGYIPKKTSPIYKEFNELGKTNLNKVQEILEWKPMFNGGHIYFFNMFYFLNGKHVGFRSPVFDDPKDNYVPVDGVKEISIDDYYRFAADKELDGRGTKVPATKRGSSGSSKNKPNGRVQPRVSRSSKGTARHP